MTKKILILLPALLLFSLSAGSGIASDNAPEQNVPGQLSPAEKREKALALFISALLEKDPGARCSQLLDVAAADPGNAETPLAVFASSFSKVRDWRKLLEKFNKLLAQHPLNPHIVSHGAELNRTCGTPAQERLRQLKTALFVSAPLPWGKRQLAILLNRGAEALLELGDFKGLLALTLNRGNELPGAAILAGPCHTAAARCYAAGNDDLGKKLEGCFDRCVERLRTLEKTVTGEIDAGAILTFYTVYRAVLDKDAMRFMTALYARRPGERTNLLCLTTAVECGDVAVFDRAAAEVVRLRPRFDPSELRFKTLLNGGKFAEAEAELKRLPEKRHFDLRRLMLLKKRDWKALTGLVSAYLAGGGAPDPEVGLLLLTASEHLQDRALYRKACALLKKHLNLPAVANAVGYVGATMGLDLEQGRQLIDFALSKEPDSAAYLDSMAWVAFKQNRFADAEKWITRALEHAVPREGVSVILEHAGDIAAALKKDPARFYGLALKYAPFDEEFDRETVSKKMKKVR